MARGGRPVYAGAGPIEGGTPAEPAGGQLRMVITASAAGTAFEWYDFFIFGSLASIIARHFFAGVEETTAFILALLVFAAGFVARPFGALVFGHFGDRMGRKWAFIVTISMMGLATFLVGLLPTFKQVDGFMAGAGIWAPIALVTLRLVQGFAIGGEYGGAAIYVAEHAGAGRRGFLTGWIQTSAAFGFLAALVVILITRTAMGEETFGDWGWRIPFLSSIILFLASLYVRLRLEESPLFKRVQEEGKIARSPLAESFFKWENLKIALLALFALMMVQGTLWYTAHFYAPFFVERVLKVPGATINEILIIAVAISAPLYVFFGWLSDRIGRKPIMLAGILMSAAGFFPAFHILTEAANPALARASIESPVAVIADPATCSVQFDPVGRTVFKTACDIAKSTLASAGVNYENRRTSPGGPTLVQVGLTQIQINDAVGTTSAEIAASRSAEQARISAQLAEAGYPTKADMAQFDRNRVLMVFIFFVISATALYGPLAAALVELFPTRIRYSGLSLPYHIGTGWFGGFLPATAFAIQAATGNIYAGLWYPVITAAISFAVGFFLLPETRKRDITR